MLCVRSSVRQPARADASAASVPACPPPTTMTSKISGKRIGGPVPARILAGFPRRVRLVTPSLALGRRSERYVPRGTPRLSHASPQGHPPVTHRVTAGHIIRNRRNTKKKGRTMPALGWQLVLLKRASQLGALCRHFSG